MEAKLHVKVASKNWAVKEAVTWLELRINNFLKVCCTCRGRFRDGSLGPLGRAGSFGVFILSGALIFGIGPPVIGKLAAPTTTSLTRHFDHTAQHRRIEGRIRMT